MKIKGAFSVRWAPKNGEDGTGVVITKTEVKYAVGTSGTSRPSSGWGTSVPSVTDGQYLWTWTHVEYSDGTKTDSYSVARQGIDGKGIQSSVVTYSQQATSVNPDTIRNWGSFPAQLTDGYWLYTRTLITYSGGDTTTSYSVSQIGTGSYYAGVEEYYKAGESPTTAPDGAAIAGTYVAGQTISTSWTQERPTLNKDTPYLWNFEISADSKGNRYVTGAVCIGNFAKGITSIVETYAISAQGSAPSGRDYPSDIAENDWKDEHFASAPTNSKPFQWNKTVVTYNDSTTQVTYHVSAVKGIDGKGAVYIDLDNESDSMLYDGQGNRVGGASICNIKLYDNGEDVTSGKTFSIKDKSSTVTASIKNNNVLEVTGITSDDGYVIVGVKYNSVDYTARYTIKRLAGTDKYEIICTPSALTYNSSTDSSKTFSVEVNVYRTSQNGTRTLLQTLPTGFTLKRYWSATGDAEMTYTNGKATFNPVMSWDYYRVELLEGSVVVDQETIPISHVVNGTNGKDVFVLDIDNEHTGLIVEDDGLMTTSQIRVVKFNAFYGTTDVTENCDISVTREDSSQSSLVSLSTPANGQFTISSVVDATWSKSTVVNVRVTATHSTYGTRTMVVSVVPVFGGAKADYYEIKPSLDSISFSKSSDGKSLTPLSRSLSAKCIHVTAKSQDVVDVPSGYSVRYSYLSSPQTTSQGTALSSPLTIYSSTSNTSVFLSLFKGSTLIDTETIPIIKSGVDGADNIGVSISLNNNQTQFPMTNDGKSDGRSEHDNFLTLQVGNSVETLTQLEATSSDSNVTVSTTKVNNVHTGAFKVTIPSGKSFSGDQVRITLTAKSANCTSGKSIVFILQGVRAGKNGEKPVLYELLPSTTAVSFGRTSSGALTPSYVDIYCGYQKNDGGTISNYPGNDVKNLSTDGGAPYNIFFRYHSADGSKGQWNWAKDLIHVEAGEGVIRMPSYTSYVALEYVLSSSSGYASVSDTNIIDRQVIPITKAGEKGNDGGASKTIYKDDFEQPTTPTDSSPSDWGRLSVVPAGLSVIAQGEWYKDAEGFMVAPDIPYGSVTKLVLTVFTTKANQSFDVYVKSNTNTTYGLIYIGELDKDVSTSQYVEKFSGSTKTTKHTFTASSIGVHSVVIMYAKGNSTSATSTAYYVKVKAGNPSSWKSTSETYNDDGSVATWSTPVEVRKCTDINATLSTGINLLFQTNFDSDRLEKWNKLVGSVNAGINGRRSFRAINDNNVFLDFLQQKIYDHQDYYWKKIEGGKWYTLSFYARSETEGQTMITYIYPPTSSQSTYTCIDIRSGYLVDGAKRSVNTPVDTNVTWTLSKNWIRHSVSFKTIASIPQFVQQLLFRLPPNADAVYICMPQLEEGVMASDYKVNDEDFKDNVLDTSGFPNNRGVYDPSQSYHWNDIERDFIDYEFSGTYYRFGVKRKGMVIPANTPPTSVQGDSNWQVGSKIHTLITDTIFGENANIGGFQVSNNMMRSANGSLTFDGVYGLIRMLHDDGYVWEITSEGRNVLGVPDGQRVEIDPSSKDIRIYDAEGFCTSIFEGNSYNSINELFGNSSGIPTLSSNANYCVSRSYANNNSSTAERSGTVSLCTFATSTPTEVFTILSIQARSHSEVYQGGTSGPIQLAYSSSYVRLYIKTYSDSTKNTLIQNLLVDSISANAFSFKYNPVKADDVFNTKIVSNTSKVVAGYHEVVIEYHQEASIYGSWSQCAWGNAIVDNSLLSSQTLVTYNSEFYVSRFFANGFALGIRNDNYVAAFRDSNGMNFIAQNGNYGVKVTNNSVQVKVGEALWKTLKIENGYVKVT